jgi:hypothetical protein
MTKKLRYKKWKKIIKESGLFDSKYYLFTYPDVRKQDVDPIEHFIMHGAKEGRNPSQSFNTKQYYISRPDVKKAKVNPLVHYILYGQYEKNNMQNRNKKMNKYNRLAQIIGQIRKNPSLISKAIISLQTNGFQSTIEKIKEQINTSTIYDYNKQDNTDKQPSCQFTNNEEHDFIEYQQHEPLNTKIKTIAFYLPQFHPFPENDKWWGKGFTEWTNVTKAKPNFVGHYQPHLPIHNGFYDLRLPEIMIEQAKLAKNYGIYGFNFYYYWFDGKILMHKPFEILLNHKEIDINFCITWANENWTRRWDGRETDILIAQNHTQEDSIKFIESLYQYFNDERYIRIDNKPILIIYRANIIPDMKHTLELWRNKVREAGFDGLYLICAQTFGVLSPDDYGFDAAMEFPPHTVGRKHINNEIELTNPKFEGKIFDYNYVVKKAKEKQEPLFKLFKTCMLSWDNTARRQDSGNIFFNFTLKKYKEWLSHLVLEMSNNNKYSEEEKLIFINAWNEWAEGTHLEPDSRYGYGYLETTYKSLQAVTETTSNKKTLFIHIGFPKTGTSAIQKFCVNNYKILKEQFNLYYPDFGRWVDGSHHKIAFALTENIYEQMKDEQEQIEYLEDLERKIKNSECSNILLSSECFKLYNNANFINKFKDNYNIKIICYLRRQDEYMESCYAQIVKDITRQEKRTFEKYHKDTSNSLFYSNILDHWEKLTSKDNFIIKVYDKNSFKNGSIIEDFLDIFDLNISSGNFSFLSQNVNESLSRKTTLYKVLVNKILKKQNMRLIKCLQEYSKIELEPQKNLFLTNEERLKILDTYKDDNSRIIQKYNLTVGELFSSNINKKSYSMQDLTQNDLREITKFIFKTSPDIIYELKKSCSSLDKETLTSDVKDFIELLHEF